ncbi:hypothetical protein BDV19DRAFT_368370 [Aspergillus venezuelensis]
MIRMVDFILTILSSLYSMGFISVLVLRGRGDPQLPYIRSRYRTMERYRVGEPGFLG